MAIQWYPGHMHKAQKDIRESLRKVDIVIEVLDARIPFSSENPLLGKIKGEKPYIKLFNKSDLADAQMVEQWQQHLDETRGIKSLSVTITDPGKIMKLPDLCRKLLPEKSQSVKKMRAMIAGIPNVGKSTIINLLAGRAVAKTGNEPAVTKSQQYIHIHDDFLLLDTPGFLWPKQEYENSSYRLASTGAIKDTAMDYDDVGFFLADYLLAHYPERLMSRYQLDVLPAGELEFFETIGRQRGSLGAGGRVDLVKISELFINDFRTGALGPICMETPDMVAKEVEAHALAEEEKRAAKEARLANFKKKRR